MLAAVLRGEAVLKVRIDMIGVCNIFQSREDDFLSDFAETRQRVYRPITGWVRCMVIRFWDSYHGDKFQLKRRFRILFPIVAGCFAVFERINYRSGFRRMWYVWNWQSTTTVFDIIDLRADKPDGRFSRDWRAYPELLVEMLPHKVVVTIDALFELCSTSAIKLLKPNSSNLPISSRIWCWSAFNWRLRFESRALDHLLWIRFFKNKAFSL